MIGSPTTWWRLPEEWARSPGKLLVQLTVSPPGLLKGARLASSVPSEAGATGRPSGSASRRIGPRSRELEMPDQSFDVRSSGFEQWMD